MRLHEIYDRRDELAAAAKAAQPIIIRDCQPFLQQLGPKVEDLVLWRGASGIPDETIVKKQVRLTDRQPDATSLHDHHDANEYFTDNFGEPYRNALFVSGRRDAVGAYGMSHMVFPIGEFSYVWSDSVHDMTMDFEDEGPGTDIKEFLKWGKYQHNEGLQSAIQLGHEIMIRCKEYYMVQDQDVLKGLKDLI